MTFSFELSDIDDPDITTVPSPDPKAHPLLRLWILRILVPLKGHRKFVRRGDFADDDIAIALGFGKWIDVGRNEFDAKSIRAALVAQHAKAEHARDRARAPATLARNVKRVAKLLDLTPADCRILEFVVLLHNEDLLDNVADWLGSLVTSKVHSALARILCLPVRQVVDALAPRGILARSGLVTIGGLGSMGLRSKLDLLSRSFADQMLTVSADPVSLLRDTVVLAPKPELSLSDYGHVDTSLAILRPYLREVLTARRAGVNVFFHGPPGTGKTQLARVLARELRCDLFEVSSEDSDGDPVEGEGRLRAWRAAQSMLSRRRAMILFDEVEDVLDDGSVFMGRRSTAQTRKAWMNRMLEETPVPTFWLSNSIHGVDPAFLRRFDMIVELPVPSRSQRQRLVQQTCGDLAGPACVARIAASDHLAPALVTRASTVVRTLGKTLDDAGAERALEHLIGNTLAAQGHPRLVRHDPNRLPETYDLAFLNPDTDIRAIAEGLKANRSGRLCLYGPPGTGKTAFGRWLAHELDLPLQTKRASDILGPYVGTTEQNLALAFRQAEQDGALLMIDEVDSFLRDRKEAQRPWEVTQVNEMLTQMEAFTGIFIASTNLMDGLDQAALRRFDAKIRLGYLNPEQVGRMLHAYCSSLGLSAPRPSEMATVERISNLTPGDFTAIVRQNHFRPIGSAGRLVELLEGEAALKGGNRRPIGFLR